MKTLYRTSFNISHTRTIAQTFDDVAAVCYRWVFDPKRKVRPPDGLNVGAASTVERTVLVNDSEIEAHFVDGGGDGTTAWGLRFSHPQSDDPTLRWTSEMGLLSHGGAMPSFSCSVSVSRVGAIVSPIRQRSSRPQVVPAMLRHFKCVGAYPLMTKPIGMKPTDGDIANLLGVLQAPSRTHPIVLISNLNAENRPTVEPAILADSLAGLAHVVVTTDSQVSWMLRDRLPNPLLTYDGAVRLYWPGFRITDSPFDHPLWTSPKIESYRDPSRDLAQTLLDLISSTAIFNLHDGILTWDRLQSLARAQAIEEARAAGKDDELLALYEEDNKSMGLQLSQLNAQLAQQADELKKQRSLAENFRAALESRKSDSIEVEAAMPAASVIEAIQRAEQQHDDKLVFSFNSKSEHEGCPFEAPDEVEKAFNWLASIYWRARAGEEGCLDLDHSIRETISGWGYSGGQKKSSVGKFEEWYYCNWNGQDHWMGEHLRCGTSTKPTETIRTAFAWDKEARKIIVGFVGQHQRNRNT
jgi:hypothetical protein